MLPDFLKTDRRRGHVDAVDDMIISGWAADLTQLGAPASLVLLVDDQVVGSFTCTEPRSDLNALNIPGTRLGFRFALPDLALDGLLHRISIRFRSGEVLTHGPDMQAELPVRYHPTLIQGMVDGIFGNVVRGWVFRIDKRTQARTGGVTLEVRHQGITLARVKADGERPDVVEAHGCEPRCGFLYAVPARLRDGQVFEVDVHAVPEDVPLQGSPFRGRVLIQDNADRLFDMYAKVEALCTQVYALKDQLRQLVAADEDTIATYHRWATGYYEALRARVIAARRTARYAELLGPAPPKVSIVCPVYQPGLADFAAAVQSVQRQTWPEWELIIVDDGSRSAPLTEVIRSLCAAEPRIRAVSHKKNQGISAATNTGIAAATGEWVALFDHDDLLVDVALEVMLLAARNTGAKMLYSDEDKVDQHGYFSEPHLKPDWNYRLALTNNYVCHLLLVEAEALRAAGPLDARYDGAQDHDLVLRLSETLPAAAIHHVPELLYHWRKTAASTATTASAKAYAVDAGKQAVADHLERRGLPAVIDAVYGSTVYDVRWGFRSEPEVVILIPFKDQVELTRVCVDSILSATAYDNYRIVLIDNWSTAIETRAWLSEVASNDRICVMRMEEEFNFARINNRAAQQMECEFLLFLNNDVQIQQADWLRLMVNEALADPHVAIVGVKLLYPNDAVQHAGVVLGVGGVASHAFRMLPKDTRGYANRAVCAQEMSAVTAACMLCRADVFRDVGMFDEAHLAVAFNDVDLCLRVGRAGYRIVMTPAVVLHHHESISRGNDLAAHNLPRFYGENQCMMDRWSALIEADPFYNPHFSHEVGMFEVLSSASLRMDRAPSLFRKPVPRETPRLALHSPDRAAEPPPVRTSKKPLRERSPRRKIGVAAALPSSRGVSSP